MLDSSPLEDAEDPEPLELEPLDDSPLVDGDDEPVDDSPLVEGDDELVEDSVPVEVLDDCEPADAPLELEAAEACLEPAAVFFWAVALVLLESAGSCPEASWT